MLALNTTVIEAWREAKNQFGPYYKLPFIARTCRAPSHHRTFAQAVHCAGNTFSLLFLSCPPCFASLMYS